jgi:AcrR family transcriptional regulator
VVERAPLSRERIIAGAVAVADAGGLNAVSMRNVGKQLGVEAMSLYHHIAGKDQLLDELADWIFAQIDPPPADQPWRPAMANRATSTRKVLFDHPWSLGLIESRRNAGPAVLRHHDAALGCLRRNGFSIALAAHALSAIDAYVYGFVLTELNLPFQPSEDVGDFVATIDLPADTYPYLTEMIDELVVGKNYSYSNEFDYGLDLILDELHQRLGQPLPTPKR